MQIWVTRPDLASIVIRGAMECTAWLVKPEYSTALRAESDHLYPMAETGWVAKLDGEVADSVRVRIGKFFRAYPELMRTLIRALHESVGETIKEGMEFEEWPNTLDRWNAMWHAVEPCTYDDAQDGRKKMCVEMDVPWEVWFAMATKAAEVGDVSYARWLASLNPAVIPF